MSSPIYRALIVDDEASIRGLTAAALVQEGFSCDRAANGREALEYASKSHYDLVVTDLQMPEVHGHALAVKLLAQPARPALVVLTGVAEPKLAKDLLSRGVDEIMFKPVSFRKLAAKARALVMERAQAEASRQGETAVAHRDDTTLPKPKTSKAVTLHELEEQLASVSALVPISTTALDVYALAMQADVEISRVAVAVQRDPSLLADVMRFANSSLLGHSPKRVVDLVTAVSRAGLHRVAELALAKHALGSLSPRRTPWLDPQLIWRRSLASGAALELLLSRATTTTPTCGVLLAAILNEMGRCVLATLYPDHYESMRRECATELRSLAELERRMFPMSPARALAHMLASWNIPVEVRRPLYLVSHSFSELAARSSPVAKQAELIKLATLIAQLAVDHWEPWDEVDLPAPALLAEWNLADLGDVVERTRKETQTIAGPQKTASEKREPRGELSYYSTGDELYDALPLVLHAAGFDIHRLKELPASAAARIVIRAEHGGNEFAASVNSPGSPAARLIVDKEAPGGKETTTHHVTLPCSFAAAVAACNKMTDPVPATSR